MKNDHLSTTATIVIICRFLPHESMFDRKPKVHHHQHERSSIGCDCQHKPLEEISSKGSSDQSCSKGNHGRVQLLHTVDITKKVTEMNKKDIRQVFYLEL